MGCLHDSVSSVSIVLLYCLLWINDINHSKKKKVVKGCHLASTLSACITLAGLGLRLQPTWAAQVEPLVWRWLFTLLLDWAFTLGYFCLETFQWLSVDSMLTLQHFFYVFCSQAQSFDIAIVGAPPNNNNNKETLKNGWHILQFQTCFSDLVELTSKLGPLA